MQTTDNACATVAMLNIVMNAEGVDLGDNLAKFKESTQNLTPAVRGYAMSTNRFLLATHNSLARRIDLLNAALGLEGEYEDFTKKRKPKKAPKKKKGSSAAFHFIAYVQANGHTWELDGLQAKPRCLGEAGGNDLTTCAAPFIQERMMQAECNVNLLALCQSPVAALRHELLLNLRKQVGVGTELAKELRGTYLNAELLPPQQHWKMPGLDIQMVLPTLDKSMPLPPSFQKTLDDLFEPLKTSMHLETKASVQTKLNELTQSLKVDWMQLQAQYIGECRAEAVELGDDIARVEGRKKDCTLVIHEWLKRLAIAGKMQEAFEASQ
jgi:ubiquitin carboxyl-terminal hydrolase L5